MRNLLNTSMLAVSAMKRGTAGFGGATAAALDRSLVSMRGLIDRTLAEARRNSDESPYLEVIEMGPFIAALEIDATVEAAKRGCDLTVVVEPEIFVRADRYVLGSAVGTLLAGVIGFMHRDGHLFLSATARTQRVVIDVEDSDASLESGALREILAAFKARSVARTTLGSALLYSAKAVEANGGHLSAREVMGRGCLYTIELAASPAPA
jgi:K+-sensing histidine kinase KdpD